MRKIWVLLAVVVLLGFSCKEEDLDPQYSGEINLSSELLQSGQTYVFYGFSFETGKIATYSLSSPSIPDLAVIHLIFGDKVTADLSGSDEQDAFYKNGIFSSAAEAEAYFNNYTQVISEDFEPLAQDVKINQVWTVQTADKHFAKIWIKEITLKESSISQFVDLRIQYQYQPDGSRSFDCDCE